MKVSRVSKHQENGFTNLESSKTFAYQRFEIIQNIIGQSSGLRLYCFIPTRDLEGQKEIEKNQSKNIPYRLVGENAYSVSLFNVTHQMFGVHSTSRVCKCVRNNQIFLISRPTFQDMEHKGVVMSPESKYELEPPRKKRLLTFGEVLNLHVYMFPRFWSQKSKPYKTIVIISISIT